LRAFDADYVGVLLVGFDASNCAMDGDVEELISLSGMGRNPWRSAPIYGMTRIDADAVFELGSGIDQSHPMRGLEAQPITPTAPRPPLRGRPRRVGARKAAG